MVRILLDADRFATMCSVFHDWSRADKLAALGVVVPACVGIIAALALMVAYRSLKTARTSLTASIRPVLIVAPELVSSERSHAVIKVRNTGPGVALNIYAECANVLDLGSTVGRAKVGRMSWGRARGLVAMLPSGEDAEITLWAQDPRQTLHNPMRLEVVLHCWDVAGQRQYTHMFTGTADSGYPAFLGSGKPPRKLRKLVPKTHPEGRDPGLTAWQHARRHPLREAHRAWSLRTRRKFKWDEEDTPVGHVKVVAKVREGGTDITAVVLGEERQEFKWSTSDANPDRLWPRILEFIAERQGDRDRPRD